MNAKMKRRMVAVTGIIVIVLIVVLAVVGSGTSAKSVTIADVVSGEYQDKRIQVTGNVVENSYSTTDNVLTFSIYDPDGDPAHQVRVSYEGGVSATFGNDVTAICTGKMNSEGVLIVSELVTKCPSKYENATDALTVDKLLEYGADIEGKPVKITGSVQAGTLQAAGQGDRMTIVSAEGAMLAVVFDGALSEEIADGSNLVVTGSLNADGKFHATDVALEG